jgi:hypothetical protein
MDERMNITFRRGIATVVVIAASLLTGGCLEDDAESGDLRAHAFYPDIDINQFPDRLVINARLYTEDDHRRVELTGGDTLEAAVAGRRQPFAQVSDGLYPAYQLVLPGNFNGETVRVIFSRNDNTRVSRIELPRRLVIGNPAGGRSYSYGENIRVEWNTNNVTGERVGLKLTADCRRDDGRVVTRSGSPGKVLDDGRANIDFAAFFRSNYNRGWNAFDGCDLAVSVAGPPTTGDMDPAHADGHITARSRDSVAVHIIP